MVKINRYISNLVLRLLTLLITILLALLFFQIILRYIFNSSFALIDELGRFMFIWITMISLSVAFREKSHLGVTAFVSKFDLKYRIYIEKVITLINIGFMTVLIYGGLKLSFVTMKQVSPTLNIPMGLIYLAMPVGAILCILTEVEKLMERHEVVEEVIEGDLKCL